MDKWGLTPILHLRMRNRAMPDIIAGTAEYNYRSMKLPGLANISDVRDGLTRKERIVVYCLNQIQKERKGRNVPTAMLYGRVVEHVNMSEQELQGILQRLTSYNSKRE